MKKTLLSLPICFFLITACFTAFAQTGKSDKVTPTLNHIAVHVVSLEKSTAFYQKILGLDTIPEPFHDGKHTWFQIGPLSHMHLISGVETAVPHDKFNHLCFTVPSMASFIENLKNNQVEFESWEGKKFDVTLRVDAVHQIYFKDLDGYWIEVNDARK